MPGETRLLCLVAISLLTSLNRSGARSLRIATPSVSGDGHDVPDYMLTGTLADFYSLLKNSGLVSEGDAKASKLRLKLLVYEQARSSCCISLSNSTHWQMSHLATRFRY